MSLFIDLTGKRFGKLKVLKRAEGRGDGRAYWLCACAICGFHTEASGHQLRSGSVKGHFQQPGTFAQKRKHAQALKRERTLRWEGQFIACSKHKTVRCSRPRYIKNGARVCGQDIKDWLLTTRTRRIKEFASRHIFCKVHPDKLAMRSAFVLGGKRRCSLCGRLATRQGRDARDKKCASGLVFCIEHPHKQVNRSYYLTHGRRKCATCVHVARGLRGLVRARRDKNVRYRKNPGKFRAIALKSAHKHKELRNARERELRRFPQRRRLELARLIERADSK